MIALIAESGGTKTDWRLCVDGNQKQQLMTSGLNPYFTSGNEIKRIIGASLNPMLSYKPTHLFFYGSGFGVLEKRQAMHALLEELFPGTQIEVQDDITAAARGILGSNTGLVGILGTGSNLVEWDGNSVLRRTPSNGLWLGDEGSGGHIGMSVVKAYLNETMPLEIRDLFEDVYEDRRANILQKVYKKPQANQYLSSFSLFVKKHVHHAFLEELVIASFTDFLVLKKGYLDLTGQESLNFTGGVAYNFITQLEKAISAIGLQKGRIENSPIEGLLQYHAS